MCRQLLDIFTKLKSIFNDPQFFEQRDSFNPEAGEMFSSDPEQFFKLTMDSAKQSREDFKKLPADCPYRFKKIQKIPSEITEILRNKEVKIIR